MYRLIYTSRTTRALTGGDLADILLNAVELNDADDVTGMLMYASNSFLQILEGEQAAVERTMERIRRSSQHTDIHVLAAAPVQAPRLFPDWAMDWWTPDYADSVLGGSPLTTVTDPDQAMDIIQSHRRSSGPDPTAAESRQALCPRQPK